MVQQLQTPPQVERVVDSGDYHVAVALDPRDVLPGLLAALGSSALLLGQAARFRAANSDEARADALSTLANSTAVREALTLRMAGGTAEDLSIDLDEACTAPNQCGRDGCDQLELDHTGLCPGHYDAAERMSPLLRGA